MRKVFCFLKITKMKVWDKAATDSVGLANYFNAHRAKYEWDERAKVQTYMIASSDEKLIKKISKKSGKKRR